VTWGDVTRCGADGEPVSLGLLELIDQVPGELWSARLGLSLLHERAKGATSVFAPYINLLPAVHQAGPRVAPPTRRRLWHDRHPKPESLKPKP